MLKHIFPKPTANKTQTSIFKYLSNQSPAVFLFRIEELLKADRTSAPNT